MADLNRPNYSMHDTAPAFRHVLFKLFMEESCMLTTMTMQLMSPKCFVPITSHCETELQQMDILPQQAKSEVQYALIVTQMLFTKLSTLTRHIYVTLIIGEGSLRSHCLPATPHLEWKPPRQLDLAVTRLSSETIMQV
jgi:hypothetical protein